LGFWRSFLVSLGVMGWMYSGTVLLFMRALWIYARRDNKVETLVSGQRVFDPWSKHLM
jgi:uncharacterized membrane protein YbaN (DUF454 family)